MPRLPFSPCGRRGAGGRGGKRTGYRRSLISPEKSTLEKGFTPMVSVSPHRRASPWIAEGFSPTAMALHPPFRASGRPASPFSSCGRKGVGGMRGQTRLGSSPTSTLSCTIVNNIEIRHHTIPCRPPYVETRTHHRRQSPAERSDIRSPAQRRTRCE